MASAKVATKKASKSMPSKKEEGTVWVSPDGILYTEPKIDADLLKKSRENKYIVEGLGKQRRLIFRKGLKVELIDRDNDDKADEKESKFLMTMVRKPEVALHNKIQLLWEDAMEFGCGPYNDAWADTDEGYVMTKLNRLPPETFENCGASVALVYNRILQGIRWNHETKKTEYWQTQADGSIVQLSNVGLIVDPLCGEIGGTPYIIPLVPFVNMLRFLWNKKMQEANIFGAGGLYFIKVKNPQGDDTEFAQKILNNESGDVRFQLRENMDLVVITVSGTGVAIEGIQEAQSQVQTFFTASNLIQKDGTLIGGSSQPEFDLFMAYLESTHRWLEEAVRIMLLPYLKGNGFASNWDIKVTIPDLEYDKSQTLLSAVSSAYTTKSITLAERRKVYEKVGIDTKDMTPAEEKALLAEYEANNPAPVMSPMLQKVEAMAKVISATPLDPHAFVNQEAMKEAIDALDGEGKKGLPFLPSQPTTKGSMPSSQHLHGGPGSGRYPAGSSDNSFHEQVSTVRGRRYISVISNDNNDEEPEYMIKVWDVTDDKQVKSMSDIFDLSPSSHGPRVKGELSHDLAMEYFGDGVPYKTMEEAEVGLKELLKPEAKTHGGAGSGRYPKGSGSNEVRGTSSSKPLSMKTLNMDQNTQPKSTLEKQSREIIASMPAREEWANPRGREIAELAAMAHGTGMTTNVAQDENGTFEGIIAHYNDADGVNITYLASVGKTKGVGSDLLKKTIEANVGKDINLFADPGAVTYYQHIGMEQLSGDEEKGGVFRWAAKDAKAFADKGTEKINKAIDGIFEHGGPGSGRYPKGSKNPAVNVDVAKKFSKSGKYPDKEWKHFTATSNVSSIEDEGIRMSDGNFGMGVYLTEEDTGGTRRWADAEVKVYVDVKNPIVVRGYSDFGKKLEELGATDNDEPSEFLKSKGYDAVEVTNKKWLMVLDQDNIAVVKSEAKMHGGPGSGRYPAGSGDDGGGASSKGFDKEASKSLVVTNDHKEYDTKLMKTLADGGGAKVATAIAEAQDAQLSKNMEYAEARSDQVGNYTGTGYLEINKNLRSDGPTTDAIYAKMDKVIDESPELPRGTVMYRGVGEHSAQRLMDMKPGDTCNDKAYQSFSTNPRVASTFTSYTTNKGKRDAVIIRAVSNGNQKGFVVGHAEHEIIMPRGTAWKVVSNNAVTTGFNAGRVTTHVITVVPV